MLYILKNKDKDVLKFEVQIETQSFKGQSFNNTYFKDALIVDENLLPIQIRTDNLLASLESFIKNRKVPQNRQFVEKIIATYSQSGKEMLMDYINVSLGLSLNDAYWIVPANSDYKWADFNLYENEFSDSLERASFGDEIKRVTGFTSSPEYTTNGMLKKCWHRENGQIYLYKGTTQEYANGGKEAYSEFFMAQVAKVMQFDCVSYDLKLFHNQVVSSCLLFTNENEGYIPVYNLLKEPRESNKVKLMQEISEIFGDETFEDLMLFDALICNKDRHLGNFGMIVDNNTNKILRAAPIFDNGFSMMNFLTYDELKEIEKAISIKKSYFELSFDEQLRVFVQPRHIENLTQLSSFCFTRHNEFNLSDSWLEPLELCIQGRAKKAIEFALQKQKIL